MFSIKYGQLTSHECSSTVIFKLGSGEKLQEGPQKSSKRKNKIKIDQEVNNSQIMNQTYLHIYNSYLYLQLGHYLRVQPFVLVSERFRVHSIPHCTAIMSVQSCTLSNCPHTILNIF